MNRHPGTFGLLDYLWVDELKEINGRLCPNTPSGFTRWSMAGALYNRLPLLSIGEFRWCFSCF
jgi:hypothetical protein